jgi:hypothetical protein
MYAYRQQLIDAFQENDDVFVFLLSTKAGMRILTDFRAFAFAAASL